MSYRYESLLRTKLLDLDIDQVNNFELSKLNVLTIKNASLKHLRLGKQIERWVALAIKESNRYDIVLENIQVYRGKITIGEFDFILSDSKSKRLIHLELVYKFYLYRPSQGLNEVHKWIGPNLKDSLIKKVEKLKNKQFPLLYKEESKSVLGDIDVKDIDQNLCFMANLFVPFGLENESYKDINNEAITGYWYSITDFLMQFDFNFSFYLPIKSEWGINPKYNLNWLCFEDIAIQINKCHLRKFSPLCWIKDSKGKFSQCFIVWW